MSPVLMGSQQRFAASRETGSDLMKQVSIAKGVLSKRSRTATDADTMRPAATMRDGSWCSATEKLELGEFRQLLSPFLLGRLALEPGLHKQHRATARGQFVGVDEV